MLFVLAWVEERQLSLYTYEKRKAEVYSKGYSQALIHSTTNRALHCLALHNMAVGNNSYIIMPYVVKRLVSHTREFSS